MAPAGARAVVGPAAEGPGAAAGEPAGPLAAVAAASARRSAAVAAVAAEVAGAVGAEAEAEGVAEEWVAVVAAAVSAVGEESAGSHRCPTRTPPCPVRRDRARRTRSYEPRPVRGRPTAI
ncbi:hypothetical protein [Streptomyces sp. NPDC056672]|uniref:hypothetical protein n=1 Tax=Streptomyces sp. NPDC056672 TaxID=3345906 RepID=UPI00369E3565